MFPAASADRRNEAPPAVATNSHHRIIAMSTVAEPVRLLDQARRSEFSLAEARRIVGNLFKPDPRVYWFDFLVTIVTAHAAFFSVRRVFLENFTDPIWLGWTLATLAFAVSCLLYYRAAMFIHELIHLPRGEFDLFSAAWNLLCGIPFLMPSFTYYTHIDHHRRKHYGTEADGEYMPLGSRPSWYILGFLLLSVVIPVAAFFRFLVLTPLTWISPAVRDWVYARASSMVMDPLYIRPLPGPNVIWTIRLQEALTFLWCLGLVVVLAVCYFVGGDVWATRAVGFIIQAYLTGVVVLTINAVRTLGAHRWYNDGREMTFLEQMVDSVNYPHNAWLTELWGPVGTRYHALHHLFPSMPYHALPEAHDRLMRELPENSPYRLTEERWLTGALWNLWSRAAQPPEPSPTEAGDVHDVGPAA